ncbi:MAG: hypothetical protein Hens2KO_15990 [Henriciella sp.]
MLLALETGGIGFDFDQQLFKQIGAAVDIPNGVDLTIVIQNG